MLILWEACRIMGDKQWEEVSRTQSKTDRPSRFYRGTTDTAVLDALRAFTESYKDKKKVLVCEPSIGIIDYRAHESIISLMTELARYQERTDYRFFKTCLGRLMVAYSREKFAEAAIDAGFDYIFYIDDDHIYPNNLFESLEKYLDEYDIVAPLCVQRKHPYYPVLYKSQFNQKEYGVEFENKFYTDFKKGDLVNPDAIGFGCAIVKVDLFKRMEQPWYFSMTPIGEDILFSMKATKQYGAKILVDTNVEALHIPEGTPVGWKDYVNATQKN